MKIVVVSDSHGDYQSLLDIVNKEYGTDIYIHLGDYSIPDYLMSDFLVVKGNNDYGSEFPFQRTITIGKNKNIKIHLEHGFSFMFLFNREKYIKEKDCDIFLFGHSHKKEAYKEGKTFVFNPGSLTKPRDESRGSYLVLNIDENSKNGEKFELKYEFKYLDDLENQD